MPPSVGFPFIQRLPPEVLSLIFSYCGHRELIHLQTCCRRFLDVIHNDAHLAYIIALAAASLYDGAGGVHTGDISSAQMLDKLRRYEDAWLQMEWTEHIVVKPKSGEQLAAPGNPLIWTPNSHLEPQSVLLRFLHFSSNLRNATRREWEIHGGEHSVFSYGFNLARNLLVVQTADVPRPRYHFLSLSDGQPHPDVNLKRQLESDRVIHGLLLTKKYMLLPSAHDQQTLIDWEDGRRVTDIQCNYYSIGLLDVDYLLVLPPPRQASGPCILVYRLQEHVAPILAFGLPSFAANHPMDDCTIKCGPRSSYPLSQFTDAPFFYNDPEDSLISVGFTEYDANPSFELVVPTRHLLAYVSFIMHSDQQLPLFIPWDKWGPARTHITKAMLPPRIGWQDYCIFGTRRISIRPRRRPSDRLLVADVWDYNSRRVARARLLEAKPDDGNRNWRVRLSDVVDEVWSGGGALETRLPHIWTEMVLPHSLQEYEPENISLSLTDNGVHICTASQLNLHPLKNLLTKL